MRLKNISKNLTAKLTVNRINRLLRLKRFGSIRLIGFGYILPTLMVGAAEAAWTRLRVQDDSARAGDKGRVWLLWEKVLRKTF